MRRSMQILTVLLVLFLALPALAAVPADWPKQLNFGVIPTESTDNVTERYSALARHLEEKLGIPVQLQVATDYAGVITAMQFKHIELAYFGPKSYVDAAQRANAEAFVMQLGPDGNQGYHSVIITKKGSPIQNIEDAKSKVFAFTDPNSTSGTLVPLIYFMKEKQIDPEKYFSRVIYAGNHDAAVLALLGDRVDAASTNDLNLLRGDGKSWNTDKDFRIIWQSKLIPNSPVAFRKDIPKSLKQALKQAFTSFTEPEALKQLKAGGYIPIDDAAYDPIREQIEVKKQLEGLR